MVRKMIIAGNWKMNMNCNETTKLCEELKALVQDPKCDVVICPPFTSIGCATLTLDGTLIGVGAQNFYPEDNGAYTGEISPGMLKDLGVRYVIIGHSERREYFNEDDKMVNKKVKKALEVGLIPIMCVGEKLEEREAGTTNEIVGAQIKSGLEEISADDMKKIVIAYEPVWAIGTGKTASPKQAQEVHKFIRDLLKKMYDDETAEAVRIHKR
jgi:triosephosphate isomerase